MSEPMDIFDNEVSPDIQALVEKCEKSGFDCFIFTSIIKNESAVSFSDKQGIIKISAAAEADLKEMSSQWTVGQLWYHLYV